MVLKTIGMFCLLVWVRVQMFAIGPEKAKDSSESRSEIRN